MTIKSNIDGNYKGQGPGASSTPQQREIHASQGNDYYKGKLQGGQSQTSQPQFNVSSSPSIQNSVSHRPLTANDPETSNTGNLYNKGQIQQAKSHRDSSVTNFQQVSPHATKKPPLSNSGFLTPQSNVSISAGLLANRNALSGSKIQTSNQSDGSNSMGNANETREKNNSSSPQNQSQQKASLSSFVTQVQLNNPPAVLSSANQFAKQNPSSEDIKSNKMSSSQSSPKNINTNSSIASSSKNNDDQQHQVPNYQIQQQQHSSNNQNSKGKGKDTVDILSGYFINAIAQSFFNKIKDSTYSQLLKDHLHQCIQAISFVKTLPQPSIKAINEKQIELKKHQQYADQKTIVFDLDETLIHCNQSLSIPSDVILPINFPNGDIIEAGINIRSYCQQCLEELSKYYEIIVFTASHSCYANVVLDYIDPQRKLVQHRLFRENCVATESGVYVKDLRVIANRNLSDMLLVDNAAYSFGFQLDNGIPIIPFYDNKSDMELKFLTNYLKNIYNNRDLREINSQIFKMHRYSEFNDAYELLDQLYSEEIKLL